MTKLMLPANHAWIRKTPNMRVLTHATKCDLADLPTTAATIAIVGRHHVMWCRLGILTLAGRTATERRLHKNYVDMRKSRRRFECRRVWGIVSFVIFSGTQPPFRSEKNFGSTSEEYSIHISKFATSLPFSVPLNLCWLCRAHGYLKPTHSIVTLLFSLAQRRQ